MSTRGQSDMMNGTSRFDRFGGHVFSFKRRHRQRLCRHVIDRGSSGLPSQSINGFFFFLSVLFFFSLSVKPRTCHFKRQRRISYHCHPSHSSPIFHSALFHSPGKGGNAARLITLQIVQKKKRRKKDCRRRGGSRPRNTISRSPGKLVATRSWPGRPGLEDGTRGAVKGEPNQFLRPVLPPPPQSCVD